MKTVHTLSLTCKEATDAFSRQEEGQLSLFLRIRLFLHRLSCTPCRRFFNQCKLILKGIRSYRESASVTPLHQLDAEKKQQIQEQLNKWS
jgi:hypothetical protein